MKSKTIIIGIGTNQDPFPQDGKDTDYWIFASECAKCGCSGRIFTESKNGFYLTCELCREQIFVECTVNKNFNYTYIYWCNSSKFACDYVVLEKDVCDSINNILDKYEKKYEIPRWAVKIINGKCQKMIYV